MTNEGDTVLTPAGPRSRSQVHAVAPGSVVRRTREGTYRTGDLRLQSGAVRLAAPLVSWLG
jgi:hypothetical protein